LLAVIGAGCAQRVEPQTPDPSGQTYAQAIAMICDVDRLAGLSDDDPLSLGQRRSAWLGEHVNNADGIYFRTTLSVKGADDQAKALRDEARRVALEKCGLADSIEQQGAGGISP
jgi:hypothetical protein